MPDLEAQLVNVYLCKVLVNLSNCRIRVNPLQADLLGEVESLQQRKSEMAGNLRAARQPIQIEVEAGTPVSESNAMDFS